MGRAPCCAKVGLHRGPWTAREDSLLTNYIQLHGEGHWRSLPKKAGLFRCGKSCRLRWMNYLRPDIKRGNISPDEDDLIIRMHALLGNRWSLIAGRLPGRTDNEIKNYWNTHLSKKLRSQGTDPITHQKLSNPSSLQFAASTKKKRSENKKKQKKHSGKTGVESGDENFKVHNPKPIRVSSLKSFSISRNNSFEWNTYSSGCSGQELGDKRDQFGDGVSFLIGENYQSHNNNYAADDEGNFEKLYEEYLQLVRSEDINGDEGQLDLFAESLLI